MNTPTAHFALSFNPFDKQEAAKAECFHSHDYREMTGGLGAVTKARGVGLFTAPPGGGKTRILRDYVQGLNPNLHQMSYICLSTVSIAEFYKQLCDILGVPARGGKPSMFKAIQEQILYLYKEKRQPLMLAIDECQYLNTAILNDLKMLMNYEYDSLNCFTLILCGETHFISTLRRPVHEALRQRITVHYEFQGLSDEEVPDYVRHKIRSAGGSADIINEAAMAALNSMSQHNPRIIDNTMSTAMMIAMQEGKTVIDADAILSSVNHQAFS